MSNFPRVQQYPKRKITIANGEGYNINRKGSFLRVREATAKFTLIFDETHELQFEQNDRLRLLRDEQSGEQKQFEKVRVLNDTGSDLTFQLEIGDGEISTNNTASSGETAVRTNPDTEVQIQTKAGTTLKVDDDATQTAISALETALTNLLKNDQDKRSGLTTFEGASSAEYNNSSGTVVSSGANTSGVIIRYAHVSHHGNNQDFAHIKVGGKILIGRDAGTAPSNGNIEHSIKDVFIPAGVAITADSQSVGAWATIWYEVL